MTELDYDDQKHFNGHAVMDDEDDHNRFHDAALEKLTQLNKRTLRLLAAYDGNRTMAIDCLCLAYGWPELIPMPREFNPEGKPVDAVMIALKHGGDKKKKAAASKCVKYFQDALKIPPMPGQRSEQGRLEMSKARKAQLK